MGQQGIKDKGEIMSQGLSMSLQGYSTHGI